MARALYDRIRRGNLWPLPFAVTEFRTIFMITLAGLFLIAMSGLLVWSQWRSRDRILDAGQLRRRVLTSLLMGLLGVAILAGKFVIAAVSPIAFILFWLAVLALAGLLGVSGFADLLLTRAKSRRQLHNQSVELLRLQNELAEVEERIRAGQNGAPKAPQSKFDNDSPPR